MTALALTRQGSRLRSLRLPTSSKTERLAVVVALGMWVYAVLMAEPFGASSFSSGVDAHPYWAAQGSAPYVHSVVGTWDAYLYSPAFLQLIAPLRALPWVGFVAIWTVVLLGALAAISGRRLFLWVLLFGGWWELMSGNISFLLALVLVAGFSRPGLWSFALLTKVTPGLGLIWFAARGQWRALIVAGVTTTLIVAVSVVLGGLAPWIEWVRVLATNNAVNIPTNLYLPVGREIRFPLAMVIGIYAARTDRRWLMPFVVTLTLPVVWWGGLSILFAVPALYAADQRAGAGRADSSAQPSAHGPLIPVSDRLTAPNLTEQDST